MGPAHRQARRLGSGLGVVAALVLGAAPAAESASRQAQPAASAPQPASHGGGVAGAMSAAAPSPDDRVAAALNQIGMVTCAAAVEHAARFLFEDGEANFTVQPLGPDANRWPTVIVIESAHAAMGQHRLTTLTVSPGPTCAGFYEQVVNWAMPCDQVQATMFAAFKTPQLMLHEVRVSELSPGVQLYLMPSAGGCTSVKKELFR
jgi:hypothetical protein